LFTPKPDKPVSFAALKATLKKAGYTLDAADITVAGTLVKNDKGWSILVQPSGQRFVIDGSNVDDALDGAKEGTAVEVTGDWKTVGKGSATYESVSPAARKAAKRAIFTSPHFRCFPGRALRRPRPAFRATWFHLLIRSYR
jgi:hypothetical protein